MCIAKVIGRFRARAVASLAVAVVSMLPVAGNATPIDFSGSVNDVTALGASSPFMVGDELSGSINVAIASDGSFDLTGLNIFDLVIGPAGFNLASSDIASLNGQVSTDDAALSDFSLATQFVSVPKLAGQFALGFDGVTEPFSVTGTDGSLIEGDFSAAVDRAPAVPEPPTLALLVVAVVVLGTLRRARRAYG